MKTERLDVPVPGGTLATYRLGDAPDDAPVVIAAHGITGNHAFWPPVVRALGSAARVYAPDLRGRGESRDLPGPFGPAAHAADLVAVADHVGAERAVYVGHSMGAYVTARLAADHPDRVASAVLVDGGLAIPGSEAVDPQVFVDAFLGPTLARLSMRFASLDDYLEFWHAHPAFADQGIDEDDLVTFARHDLVGEPPELRSAVSEDAVRADAGHILGADLAAGKMQVPTILVQAERGLQDQPQPMVPLEVADAWAADDPGSRRVMPVADVNHYTLVIGRGAGDVADAIATQLAG
jgi:pimeloyl-ACP methyl ester carboxylesterase